MSEAKYWSDTPQCALDGGARHGGSLDSLGRGEMEGVN